MPTPYPKCTPTEMLGLLVLLDSHKGDEDLARLADDLDLEIDEILPAVDFAEALGLVKVKEARVSFTPTGRKLVASSIRERKSVVRDQLLTTTLFKALVRALESAPDHQLSDEEVHRLIAFTTAPADDLQLNVINWGRFAELFRYDADDRVLRLVRGRKSVKPGAARPPGGGSSGESAGPTALPAAPPAPAPSAPAPPLRTGAAETHSVRPRLALRTNS
ncbi:MAG TPA: AAA-associated domain-containing protein [Thermoplasmata archaeon]|nr:AAA-associated domain-containing protein [Thermoplasmata archaeon]